MINKLKTNKKLGGKLKCTEGRLIIKVWLQEKNHHTFSDGTTIRLERGFDNFDRRYTEPIQGTVIGSENIPEGAIVLFHHNSVHAVNEIFNSGQLSGDDIASQTKLYSILERECFAWKMLDGEWQPTIGYDFALRVFKPYHGIIEGVEPTKFKNTLFMRTGDFKDLVVRTIVASDYEIIFREPSTGQESRLIRCRPYGNEKEHREEEVVAIDHGMTKKVNEGELYIGLSKSDCKSLKELTNG